MVKVEEFLGKEEAYKIVQEALSLYSEKKEELIGDNPMSVY